MIIPTSLCGRCESNIDVLGSFITSLSHSPEVRTRGLMFVSESRACLSESVEFIYYSW